MHKMIETIKEFHDKHGYYPNRVQLGKILGKDRRTIDAWLQDLKDKGLARSVKGKQIVVGDYELTC